ncbi:MAG: MarR family winged helix-turn-helix transcriptional regulator [Phycisphaerales bacterium JB058]
MSKARGSSEASEFLEQIRSLPLTRLLRCEHGTSISAVHMAATSSLYRAKRLYAVRLKEALAPLDLNEARYEILALLWASEKAALSGIELREAMLVHPATLTYTIHSLVESGLVLRKQVPTDRRSFVVMITAKGTALAAKATEALNEIDFGIGELSADQARELSKLLLKLERS